MSPSSIQATRWRSTCMIVGGAMLVVTVLVAWLMPEPSPIQERAVLVIMSLGGAFLAAGLTGMIELQGQVANMTVRGTGSLAIFVLIYFGDVTTRVSEQNQPEDKANVVEALREKFPLSERERSLEALAKSHGYASFRQMAVSAKTPELERVLRDSN